MGMQYQGVQGTAGDGSGTATAPKSPMEVASAMDAPAAPRVASGSECSGTRGTGGVGSHPIVAHCVVGVGRAAQSDLTV